MNLFEKVDCIVLFNYTDLFYYSGYDNEDAVILLTPTRKYYLTDSRQYLEATELLTDFEVVLVTRESSVPELFRHIKAIKTARLGYRKDKISLMNYLTLEGAGISLVDVSEELNSVRAVKSEVELGKIIKAQAITDKAFELVLGEINEGMTERELAARLDGIMYSLGADTVAFSSIVAFGENSAKPHAHKSNRKLKYGDPVLLDFGAKLGGYCSDMTRTFCYGRAPQGFLEHYNIVLEAQLRALDGIKAGITLAGADGFARDYFASVNLSDKFTHSLGHALGVEIHESPTLSPRAVGDLVCGTVVSVEPGLYFDGIYGIRIEDIVFVKENCVINLTKSPKNMIIL